MAMILIRREIENIKRGVGQHAQRHRRVDGGLKLEEQDQIEVGLADGERLGVHLLAEQVDVGAGVHGGAQGSPPRVSPAVTCSLAMVSMPPEPQHGS